MKITEYLLALLFLTLTLPCAVSSSQDITQPNIIKVKDSNDILFTFGSCNSFWGTEKGEIFHHIAEMKPDLWAWLGDVVYLDFRVYSVRFGILAEEKIKAAFTSVKNSSEYTKLREATTIIGVWDDHDYGKNNGGKSFKHKDAMQQIWLDFVDEPHDSIRRQRKGMYGSYYLGDETKIKVILLDVRYFREERLILPFGATDILGEEQWAWLENELKNNKAEYVVIGSGSQVLPDDRILPEHWYTESRDRLLGLIRKYQIGGVILISGDVHFAEILKYPCRERIGYDLYEFTSSGLTHSAKTQVPFVENLLSVAYPSTWSQKEARYYDKNFGVLKFSFGEKKGVKYEARDEQGSVVLEKFVPYSELEFNKDILDDSSECVVDTNKYTRFWNNYKQQVINGEWQIVAVVLFVVFVITNVFILIGLALRYLFKAINVVSGKLQKLNKKKIE